jgi:hypothetical protein
MVGDRPRDRGRLLGQGVPIPARNDDKDDERDDNNSGSSPPPTLTAHGPPPRVCSRCAVRGPEGASPPEQVARHRRPKAPCAANQGEAMAPANESHGALRPNITGRNRDHPMYNSVTRTSRMRGGW